jgi:hypothetical protein
MEDIRKNDIRTEYRSKLRIKKEQINMYINKKQANRGSKKFFLTDTY